MDHAVLIVLGLEAPSGQRSLRTAEHYSDPRPLLTLGLVHREAGISDCWWSRRAKAASPS